MELNLSTAALRVGNRPVGGRDALLAPTILT
jgi:hypothetical protein